MNAWIWVCLGLGTALGAAAAALWRPWQAARWAARLKQAQRDFQRQREQLEAKFVELAAASGKPRGLRWVRCDFEDEVSYARDRASRELSALVAVTIGFEAIEGGGMEEVEAVGNLRAATAVFRHAPLGWYTEGRALFNLSPTQAIVHYKATLEPVAPER